VTDDGNTARGEQASSGTTEEQVQAIKKLLDAELTRQLGPQLGCWPLLVGGVGVLLGLVLLYDKL
jgi:hypothetical protein